MTAFIYLPQREHAHVVSDAAVIDIDGVVIGFASKTFVIPQHPSVILTRGSSDVLLPLGREFQKYATFDEMVEQIAGDMPDLYDALLPVISVCGIDTIEVYIAGWSAARKRPEAYMLRTSQEYFGLTDDEIDKLELNVAPFELTFLHEGVIVPTPPIEEIKEHINPSFLTLSGDALRTEFTKLLELQRRAPSSFEIDGPNIAAIGGWATIATITPKGISVEVFHRWPEDKIGEPITLAPIDYDSWRPAAMSRQQRRFLERQEKKRLRVV